MTENREQRTEHLQGWLSLRKQPDLATIMVGFAKLHQPYLYGFCSSVIQHCATILSGYAKANLQNLKCNSRDPGVTECD